MPLSKKRNRDRMKARRVQPKCNLTEQGSPPGEMEPVQPNDRLGRCNRVKQGSPMG